MDWLTAFVLWTPIAVAALLFLTVLMFLVCLLLYLHRLAVGAWFLARWGEQSTSHARTVAIAATLLWLGGLIGVVPPVPWQGVAFGWFTAAGMFLKSDPVIPAAQPVTQEGQ